MSSTKTIFTVEQWKAVSNTARWAAEAREAERREPSRKARTARVEAEAPALAARAAYDAAWAAVSR
jgi:hypothetical protein